MRCNVSLRKVVLLALALVTAGAVAVGARHVGRGEALSVVRLHTTAGGNYLDLRYRVVDPVAAAPLASKNVHPTLVHERTGARFIVPAPPKLGSMRTRSLATDRIQFALFANPNRYVRPGDLVSIEMGPLTLRHVVVQ